MTELCRARSVNTGQVYSVELIGIRKYIVWELGDPRRYVGGCRHRKLLRWLSGLSVLPAGWDPEGPKPADHPLPCACPWCCLRRAAAAAHPSMRGGRDGQTAE